MKKHLLTLSILLLSHSMAHAAQDAAPAGWQAPAAAARGGLVPLPQGGRPDITPLLQSMTNLVQALTKALLNVEISPVSMGPLPVADAGVGKAGVGGNYQHTGVGSIWYDSARSSAPSSIGSVQYGPNGRPFSYYGLSQAEQAALLNRGFRPG